MIAVPLLDAHPGGHCKPPSLLAKFFRWVLRGSQRERSVPEVTPVTSGAAASVLLADVRSDWDARPMSADLSTGAFAVLDEKFEALYRPVNGRYLGTQPHPQRPGTDADVERLHADLGNDYGVRPQLDVLRDVRDALLRLR